MKLVRNIPSTFCTTQNKWCSEICLKYNLPYPISDVASWREGGGRNLNSPNSPTDQEAKPVAQEDGNVPGPVEQSDGPKVPEKRDIRIALPPAPKLNGQQQPGIISQYRAMIPPYVSHVHQYLVDLFLLRDLKGGKLSFEVELLSSLQLCCLYSCCC